MPTFVMDADWLPFDPDPSTPRFVAPPGSVDAHCHVFGPGDEFPYAPERKYTPCDAGKNQLFALRDRLGMTRNVVVQATCHGADNSAMVDALLASGGRARGVATVTPAVSDDELDDLHAAGVRGVRFNYVRRLVDPQPDDYYRAIAERVAGRGWHVVLYFEAADLAEKYDFFTSLPTMVVVDHMGRPDVTKPVDGPEFGLFRQLLADNEQIWCKVTCPERLTAQVMPADTLPSRDDAPYSDVVPFARRIVEEFPDRVLWGSDWPHPNIKSHMPDDGVLVDFIPRIAVSAQLQHKLLVDNPMRLYWPDESSATTQSGVPQ